MEHVHFIRRLIAYATLKELSSVIDVKRKMTLARELTKKHEEIFRTTLGQAIDYYQEQEPRGEYVILIEGKSLKRLQKEEQQTWNTWSILEHMQFYLDQGISVKEAMKRVAKDRGVPKREVYATWHQI